MRASALTTTVATYYPLSLSVCLLSRSPNRLLVHQLLDIQEQTTITYALPLSLSLSQTAFDYLSIRDRERKDETSSRLSSMLELDRRNDKPGSKVD